MSAYINLATVGLALSIVGVVFLANSMAVRRPRRFIQEYFGIERQQPLRTVLDQLNVKAQIFCGFLSLLAGFSLQIAAAIDAPAGPVPAGASQDVWVKAEALAVLALGIVLLTAALRLAQNAWSLAIFRRLLAEFFHEHAWNFEKHPSITREIGELLRVQARADDSIADYGERVRRALKLADRPRRRVPPDDAFAPLRNVGMERRR